MKGLPKGGSRELNTSETSEERVRVLIVEDDPRMVRAWMRTLRTKYDVHVIDNRTGALDLLKANHFDVVFLDLFLTDGNGAELVPDIENCRPRPTIVAMSAHFDVENLLRLNGRCDLVLPKPLSGADLDKAIPVLARKKLPSGWVQPFSRRFRLSEREGQLLQLAADGAESEDAMRELGCNRGTLTTYWARIFKKTGCQSRGGVLAAILRFELQRRSAI